MAEFHEDMLFKNVDDQDAKLLLDIMGKKSKKVKIWTQELRLFDPTTFKPDLILELDDEINIIELQSTPVQEKHHKRFYVYVAITTYNKKSEKEVNLSVFSTAEKSKQISYRINESNEFNYEVISLSDYDSGEIINTINYKLENNIEIDRKEVILYALVPLIEKYGAVEEYIDEVVETLLKIKGLTPSLKALAFGIEWLIVDKFVKDQQKRDILCDALGDNMTLIYEYGKNKENNGIRKGEEKIIINLLKSGQTPEHISKTTKMPLLKVKSIKRKYKL